MILCFSGWGWVQTATLIRLLHTFLHGWIVISSWRMLNRASKGLSPWFRCLQQGRYVRLLVWWSSCRDKRPMQPFHDGRSHCKPLFNIWTTYMVPVSAIRGATNILTLTPQPDSSQGYLSNTIDLNASRCFTCRLFNLMLEVIVAAIYWNLFSVYSGCLNFCNGSCASLCIIDVFRD